MSEQDILKALKLIPQALEKGNILVDFDLKKDNPRKRSIRKVSIPLPLTDRIIIAYKHVYYVVLLEGQDGLSDLTCPITMFKPSNTYSQRIEQLNILYK